MTKGKYGFAVKRNNTKVCQNVNDFLLIWSMRSMPYTCKLMSSVENCVQSDFFFFFKTDSCHVAHSGLKLVIFLSAGITSGQSHAWLYSVILLVSKVNHTLQIVSEELY
jgi:hypothetical protein